MRYKYLLFDLDGTLIDTTEGVLKSAQNALKSFGIFKETESMMNFFGPPLKYSFMNLYGLSDKDSDKAIEIYNERYNKYGCIESRIFPEIKTLLPKLIKAGYILGVATSKPQDQAEEALKFHAIFNYFNVISGANDIVSKKDEVIEEALKQFGITDSRNDVLATVAVLISTIVIDVAGDKISPKVSVDGIMGIAVSLFTVVSRI